MNASTQRPVAVVSGGSSGIGKAFVAALLDANWIVYACGRDQAKLTSLSTLMPQVRPWVCDVTDRAAVRAFAAHVDAEQGRTDLLISNAGGSREVDLAALDRTLDLSAELRVNYEGAVNLIAEFLPLLKASAPSRLIIVGSGYGLLPSPRVPLYSAAKAALHSLAGSLWSAFRPFGITVTEVCPPVVDTPSVAHRTVRKMSPERVVAQTLAASRRGARTVYPGKTRLLPLLIRIAPKLAERVVARS